MTDLITYKDLVRPVKEGGHYEVFQRTIYKFLQILQPTDHALLYQCHMMNSNQCGQSALVVCGPGRSFADPENPPKRIGSLPSTFKELEGEVDIESLRKGMENYAPTSMDSCTLVVDGDQELGKALWSIYQANEAGMPASPYSDESKKTFQKLRKRGLISYHRKWRQGWYLTSAAWAALEE